MAHAVSSFIVDYFYWLFLAILALNLMQRRYHDAAQQKRFATLYIAIMVFVLYIYAYGLIRLNLSDWFLFVYVALVALLLVFFPKTFLPFTLRCRSCGQILSFNRLVFSDSNLCAECAASKEGNSRSE